MSLSKSEQVIYSSYCLKFLAMVILILPFLLLLRLHIAWARVAQLSTTSCVTGPYYKELVTTKSNVGIPVEERLNTNSFQQPVQHNSNLIQLLQA